MKDLCVLVRWIFGIFIGGVVILYMEIGSFNYKSYKAILDSLDFFLYITPVIVAYYFYDKVRNK